MRYRPIKQLPHCCVPATLSMILERRGLPVPSQYEIGRALGLVVPEELAGRFPGLSSHSPGPAGWGTRVDLPQYSIDNFLGERGLPLSFRYDSEPSRSGLAAALAGDADVAACFDYGHLYGGRLGMGHVSLIESLNEEWVTLIESRDASRVRVLWTELLTAMKKHSSSKMGGFWLLTSI